MIRKPIILILTSRDEIGDVSQKLKEAIQKIGTHNAVIISDDKYGSAKKLSALDKLMDNGQEYIYLLNSKDKGVIKDRFKISPYSKRVTKICNMLKRFRPEYVLCVTPYAHHCMIEAKKKAKLHTKVMYALQTFTLPKIAFDEYTDVLIVENSELKQELVRVGVRSKDIMTMGLPFDIRPLRKEEITIAKQEMGIPKGKNVFLNIKDKKQLIQVFDLMIDQGAIVNLIVYCEDESLRGELAKRAAALDSNIGIFYVQKKKQFDLYLSVSDIIFTRYDQSVIYKGFKLGVPSIVLDGGEQSKKDIEFLNNKGLLLRAKEEIDVVGLMYRLLQTETSEEMKRKGLEWVGLNSLDNIAQFLVSFIVV